MATVTEKAEEILCRCGRTLGIIVGDALKSSRKGMVITIHPPAEHVEIECPSCHVTKRVAVT